MAKSQKHSDPDSLQGWANIAAHLGQPVSVAQRWAHSGMPVQKKGRYVVASQMELTRWLASENRGEPVQISNAETDLAAELRRGLSYVRKRRRAA